MMTEESWQACCMDMAATCITLDSHADSSTCKAGTEVKIAAVCKMAKHSNLVTQYTFCPVTVEILGQLKMHVIYYVISENSGSFW